VGGAEMLREGIGREHPTLASGDLGSASVPGLGAMTQRALEFLKGQILVMTPGYPAKGDEYAFAFVHTRVQAYLETGLRVDVIATDGASDVWEEEFEGVHVTRMPLSVLASVLRERHYDVICLHFLDRHNARVLEGVDLSRTRLLLWCHGAETLYWDSPKFTTGYFQPQRKLGEEERLRYEDRDRILGRLDVLPNLTWVFVSSFCRTRARELTGVAFDRSVVIHNCIDERVFPYRHKDPQLRKRIFVVRKWDDSGCYALDTVVRTIMELSRRPYFRDLTFELCGTGPRHDELVAPLRGMDNVHIVDRFLSHAEIAQVHATCGVALFPTRFDTQGVSMLEAASSGLAVVSTLRPSVADFLPDDLDLLVPVDDYRAYADVIEQLYRDPLYFERCSEECHRKASELCGRNQTIDLECRLVAEKVAAEGQCSAACETLETPRHPGGASSQAKPLLTLALAEGAGADAEALRDVTRRWGLPVEVVRADTRTHSLDVSRAPWVHFMGGGDQLEAEGVRELCRRLADGTRADVVLSPYLRKLPYQPGSGEAGKFPFMLPEVSYSMADLLGAPYGFSGELPTLGGATLRVSDLRSLVSQGAGDLLDAGDDLVVALMAKEIEWIAQPAFCIGAAVERPDWKDLKVSAGRRQDLLNACCAEGSVRDFLAQAYL